MKTALIVGATGDVGAGIVTVLANEGWQIVAAGRNAEKLQALQAGQPAGQVKTLTGDVASEESAIKMWDEASACFGSLDVVIVSVNAPSPKPQKLFDWSSPDMAEQLQSNILTHFVAAKIFIPRLGKESTYIGIGGGMADFIAPGVGQMSMCQAALRKMYKAIAKENKEGPTIKELMIYSMVNGASRREAADPSWITDEDIGQHVSAILNNADQFPAPILTLKSREQVGKPE